MCSWADNMWPNVSNQMEESEGWEQGDYSQCVPSTYYAPGAPAVRQVLDGARHSPPRILGASSQP